MRFIKAKDVCLMHLSVNGGVAFVEVWEELYRSEWGVTERLLSSQMVESHPVAVSVVCCTEAWSSMTLTSFKSELIIKSTDPGCKWCNMHFFIYQSCKWGMFLPHDGRSPNHMQYKLAAICSFYTAKGLVMPKQIYDETALSFFVFTAY